MRDKTDALICGNGSAGICAALWLAQLGIDFIILDKRTGPMEIGQADGVQCRTVEVFESFNIADELLRDAYHVKEVAFWAMSPGGEELVKTRRTAETAPGLSHQPHLILNQAKMNDLMLRWMREFRPECGVEHGWTVKAVELDETAAEQDDAHCVGVKVEREGEETTVRARYVPVSLYMSRGR